MKGVGATQQPAPEGGPPPFDPLVLSGVCPATLVLVALPPSQVFPKIIHMEKQVQPF